MMLTCGVELVEHVRQEIEPLLRRHYEEIALYQEAIPLDPDWGTYRVAEAHGELVIVTLRESGKLVGYAVFFLRMHPHYRTCLFAMNDVFYVAPEHRSLRAAYLLIDRSEEALRALDVARVAWHVKVSNDWRKLLHRKGYVDEEVVVGKLLKES